MTSIQILAPVPGVAVALADVPDPVFSQGMVGWGAAVNPPPGPVDAVAPVGGKLFKLMPHAYVVMTPDGVGVLTHLGLDTVKLNGEGFIALAAEGDEVAAGQPLMVYDVPAVTAAGYNPIALVVVMDERDPNSVTGVASGEIDGGGVLFTVSR
ncbi:PTS sugar transporter subunit IIA [Mycolicibacterium brumae]|uniref:PTS glucose transporter subunit IIA n=1 Tax=Mycolicibacterium brumae TaxID=85968 RepID=A0A2G5PFM0_9MYCO|nr:PTS glucose transporter subunit IIA [Mycolicibacterium brumae]MCV7191620.1 PTS glucose transporter subunit IIA [Mycolicibacterium brumae]PIB76920.1 PTS glucose transporter subunit IIA [Mycolicibacterium brumae]RWA20526.1 hypothetical protein MBRU_02385 [Mycolicibacterium brumae DSM 44177]UWW07622.1 PTS glucose transporter subunit IIA [Mycolicibacterium brumae]